MSQVHYQISKNVLKVSMTIHATCPAEDQDGTPLLSFEDAGMVAQVAKHDLVRVHSRAAQGECSDIARLARREQGPPSRHPL